MTATQKAGPQTETGPHATRCFVPESSDDQAKVRALEAAAGYAVLVETGEGKYRRRLFLTLASAERAVDRARDRGKFAELVLVRVVPVEVAP